MHIAHQVQAFLIAHYRAFTSSCGVEVAAQTLLVAVDSCFEALLYEAQLEMLERLNCDRLTLNHDISHNLY